MDEIKVKVEQSVGSISWNYNELKQKLHEETARYAAIVYDDNSISNAKKDIAFLRSLAKDIDTRRKDVKNKCLEPYTAIEKEANQLIEMINEPILVINKRVEEYETARKAKVKAEITAYWDKAKEEIPEDLRDLLWNKAFDERWLNSSTTKKTWKNGIDSAIAGVKSDLESIRSTNSIFVDDVLEAYKKDLNLSHAIITLSQLNAQRDRILRAEELAEKGRKEPEKRCAEKDSAESGNTSPKSEIGKAIGGIERRAFCSAAEPNASEDRDEICTTVLKIYGSTNQINKVKGYIKYVGAAFEEERR